MDLNAILVVALLFLAYSLISRFLENTSLTAPMIFTAFGIGIALTGSNLLGEPDMSHGVVHTLAEITLIFVLFTDAARINFGLLKEDHILPTRLLLVGMPLTIVFGTVIAIGIFRGSFSFWEAALLAAILAPTDAALGQAVVSSEMVPIRIRQALSVESGLNDGIALPLVLILASLAGAMNAGETGAHWVQFAAMQVILGPLVGITVGFVGAKLVTYFVDKDWLSHTFEGICALSIAVIAFAGAELAHGNGFISAFVAGLAFGNFLENRCEFLYEFAESEGQFFTLTTFLIFGTIAISLVGEGFEWSYLIYGVFSLTIIRIIPAAISMIGTGVNRWTVLFLGWFGPRGLASILFALLILEKMEIGGSKKITAVVVVTVLLSVLLHGLTAAPLSRRYGATIRTTEDCEEMKSLNP